jgi:Fic family protein
MKKPQIPPPLDQLFQEINSTPGRMLSVFKNMRPVWENRYYHWDTLHYRKPPKDLALKEWWAATKLARTGQFRQVGLKDLKGLPFQFGLPDPALEYLHKIDQNAFGQIQTFGKEITRPETREKYLLHSLIEEAITSSQLEGATSTRQVAKEMIRLERPPRNKSEKMILNNYLTMRLIKGITDKKLSIEIILDLHRKLSVDTMEDPNAVGRFRNREEEVLVYDNMAIKETVLQIPPPAEELNQRIQTLCDFANDTIPSYHIHPVIRSIILHFWLAYDHPFVDGNGRCARALFYWSMLKHGYWLCEYLSISQILRKAPAQYARSFLYTESDDNDLTYFILYNLNVLVRAIDELHSYIAVRSLDLKNTDRLLRGTNFNLNHRQIDLLQHALRHTDALYTVKSHQKSNNIVNQTARTDLLSLVHFGFLEKKYRGKEMFFLPVENLEFKIKGGKNS